MADEFNPTDYDFDPRPTDEAQDLNPDERIAVVRTSDRGTYRRCRRRWNWSSHLRGNLGPVRNASPLWTGSGFHFALEDFHGWHKFPTATSAFLAFRDAYSRYSPDKVPADIKEQTELAVGMLNYYENSWLKTRDPLHTYWVDGEPQVEVNFRIELPWEPGRYGFDRVIYSGTIDRVAVDEYDQLWIVEYKTAKTIQTLHLALDPQVSNYCWAGSHIYGRPITGVIYQQHLKDICEPPKILSTGRISTDARQRTTHSLYRKSLQNLYGPNFVEKAPRENLDVMNLLATKETEDYDIFVRRDKARRNAHQCQAEGVKILMEVEEMLDPDLPMYPSPTRDCVYMCDFHGPCETLDDGGDWEYELGLMTRQRDLQYDAWRQALVYPKQQNEVKYG